MSRQVIISESHRGLLFEDGRFVRALGPGRYRVSADHWWQRLLRHTVTQVTQVDVRQRELTLKGQEILTADKVAIRVSILVQFQVTDPKAAVLNVESYEDRIYSDVQLAARRSLAGMTLEDILTNRTRLSEEILHDVREGSTSYGVQIRRADVKDLVFPGNLQEVMNRVLIAERLSQAELVEARTKAETARIDADIQAVIQKQRDEAHAQGVRAQAQADADARLIAARAELEVLREREGVGKIYDAHPSLMRVEELLTMRDLAKVASANLYIGFDKHVPPAGSAERPMAAAPAARRKKTTATRK